MAGAGCGGSSQPLFFLSAVRSRALLIHSFLAVFLGKCEFIERMRFPMAIERIHTKGAAP